MSYTQFVATATCTVINDFNVQSYLNAISERCVKEENFIFHEYGFDFNGELDVDFNDYVRFTDNQVMIECDTEESNHNSQVWDWLIDQFVPVMKSQLMEIKSATIDSRSGVDVNIIYITKDGNTITTEQLIENYKTTLSQV